MIDVERLKLEFKILAEINSPPRKEGELAQHLVSVFEALGARCFFDHSGAYTKSAVGNLIVKVPGEDDLPPLFLCAHMDTVEETSNLKLVEEAGIIRNEGAGILGADDKSGIAILIEVVRALRETGTPHPPLEIVFTTCEEIGLFGARYLDYGLISARMGYVLDTEDPREVIVQAPEAVKFTLRVLGRAAHAGLEPEKGLSAIMLAAEALSRLPNGRIDEETTLNFGTIQGGKATNIVPEEVVIEGEIRSHDLQKLEDLWRKIEGTFSEVIEREKGVDGRPVLETRKEEMFPGFKVPEDHPVLKLLNLAAEDLGIELRRARREGGSDANIFNRRGITTVILGTGMRRVHSPEEYLVLEDMVLCARLLLTAILKVGEGAFSEIS
ncbi:M20/M25/M40 family metallo-hydrolase [Thermosulfurimonas dismutans]|uniref:Peptidase T n=1 Tax=Thermosulfurimonas dismutans TaxID=999894 RepID=A0A179D6P4_9BACT|nr:M20/M25/M40 family metallo-hydrolase [Thermosulfurimonas dismutans]OAQ21461.1 Peptidase T [Thermosulfurimonas dismutans]